MNAAQVLGHFDRIGEADGAIPRLRRFILDLAVRGKVVEQDPTDEPASEVIGRIRRERELFTTGGRNLSAKNGLQVVADRNPFDLPKSWVWSTLGEVAQYGRADKVESNKGISATTWVLDLEDIEKDTSRLVERICSADRPFQSAKTRFQRGDVLFGKLRPYLNKVIVADEDGVCTSEIIPICGFQGIEPEYIRLVLKSPLTMNRVDQLMYGMKMPRLGTADAKELNFPLPPLAEQGRIVAKVDELKALCDRLEAARDEREATRSQLTTANLARLNEPDPDPVVFSDHARFALDNIASLTARPDQVTQLRQTILSLAVRGKLVPQDSRDEAASELLRRVSEKKAQLVNQGVLTASRSNAAPAADGQPYPVCSGWEWVRLGDIADVQDPNPSHRMPHYVTSGGVPFISSENFSTNDGIDFSIGKRISRDTLQEQVERFPILPGAIGLTRIGTIGKTRFLPPDRTYGISHAVCVINPADASLVNMRFVRLALGVDSILSFAHKGTRSIGVPDLGMAVIRSMALPFPPYAEQHRIVAKVDELMALCDRLEQSLAQGESSRSRLLEAVLHEALATDLEEAA